MDARTMIRTGDTGYWRWLVLVGVFALAGCPPRGQAPEFEGATPDMKIVDAAAPEAGPRVDEKCVDHDDDGFVEGDGCEQHTGDCAPRDPARRPGVEEVCNGLDDDCDGETDESDPDEGEACETGQSGVCSEGTKHCKDKRMVCKPDGFRSEEVCNGLDDDCDGRTDETFAGIGTTCDTSEHGVCAEGTQVCLGGEIVCDPLRVRGAERCNGKDDDCDGMVDEGNPGGGTTCTTNEPGVCGAGVERCVAGAIECVSEQQPSPGDPCDGFDNDCDGETDEEDPALRPFCETGGEGVCATGRRTCVNAALICVPDVESSSETCNRQDDDCDGQVDEDWTAQLGHRCSVGVGACERASIFVCALDGLGVTCDTAPGNGTPERCNGRDDDCDGAVDEDFELDVGCEVGVGECRREGTMVCAVDGRDSVCSATAAAASDELCNALDDDCDGSTDEDFGQLGTDCTIIIEGCVSPGEFICTATGEGVECSAEPIAPTDELCNGIDDDCDGEIDEDFVNDGDEPSKGDRCEVGLGACYGAGDYVCTGDGGGIACSAVVGTPTEEQCDGIDNDCDGRTDERVECAAPPSGVVDVYEIAPAAEIGCADLSGNGAPDNFAAALARQVNGPLAESLRTGVRSIIARGIGFPPAQGQAFRFELLPGVPLDPGFAAFEGGVDARGFGRAAVEAVALDPDGRGETVTPGATARLVSPLFFDRHPDFQAWSWLELRDVRITGTFAIADDGGLQVADAWLTGDFDRQRAVDDIIAAEEACLAAGPARPDGCAFFDEVTAESLAAVMQADLDRDETPGAESISACFRIGAASVAEVEMPPVGGQVCEIDLDCPLDLVCRPVSIVEDVAVGAALAPRCGRPEPGDGVAGMACEEHDDCRHGLCAEYSAGGGRCSRLCERDDQCPADMACRGVGLEVEGAVNAGGSTARICVLTTGTGETCTRDDDCEKPEVCGLWVGAGAGIAGAEVTPEGRCEQPDPAGVSLGAVCDGAFDCVHGNGCVLGEGDTDELVCTKPCTSTVDCSRGEVCRDRGLPLSRDLGPILHGHCLPFPPQDGAGGPCSADVDCPGGNVCTSQRLASSGTVDGWCHAGGGFFHVGQACAIDGDCASDRCVGAPNGICGGVCQHNDDCGPDLGCRPDSVFVPETDPPIPFAGQCRRAELGCLEAGDCEVDPVCDGGRCVCDQGLCRIGCARQGIGQCDGDFVCELDGRCAHYCRDDAFEPDDVLADASFIDVSRQKPFVSEQHRLCSGSAVDWYRFEPKGQPFRLRLRGSAGGDDAYELRLFDEDQTLLAIGEETRFPGERVVAFEDAEVARGWEASSLYVRVRGAGPPGPMTYELATSILFPECPDPEEVPRDFIGDFTPIAMTPGQASSEVAAGWICPQDVDWYTIFIGNGDAATITLDVSTEDTGGLGIRAQLIGPGFPSDVSTLIGQTELGADGGTIEFTGPAASCDIEHGGYDRCHIEGFGLTTSACRLERNDCFGATYFIRVVGGSALDRAEYTLSVDIDRAGEGLTCVPDAYEGNNYVDVPSYDFGRGATPLDNVFPVSNDAFSILVGATPVALRPSREIVIRAMGCSVEWDTYRFFYEPDLLLFAELRQLTETPVGTLLAIYDPALEQSPEGGIPPFALADSSNVVSTLHEVRTGPEPLAPWSISAGIPGAISVPYELTIRAEPDGYHRDVGCANPKVVDVPAFDDVEDMIGSTRNVYDDHRSDGCFGFGGPDVLFRLDLPGPGRVTVIVEAEDDQMDPAVSLRTVCGAVESELACNNDDRTAGDPTRRAQVIADVPSDTIFVVVDSFSEAKSGAFRVSVDYEAAGR